MSNSAIFPTPSSAADVVSHIKSGDHVFVHGAAATPDVLLRALCARQDLHNVTLYHLHTQGQADFTAPEFEGRIRSVSLFVGPQVRQAVAEGRADFIPVFLSDIPGLFTSGAIKLDVALLQLSPPDAHGSCTLSTSVDAALAASRTATKVLAQVNRQAPRTLGHSAVSLARLTAYCEVDAPLPESAPATLTQEDLRIGELVAALVEDGSCLQVGIGAIPDAVLAALCNKSDLGIHTEMFSDGMLPLLKSGAISNARKSVHAGRSVTSFVSGTKQLFDYVHDNALVEFHPCDRTNDTALISKNDRTVAINSALQVDLSGQICADSLGDKIFSGIGGQMDFIRGAARSKGGKAIIALPSTAAHGSASRIAMHLQPGSGVVTTRGHVHWIVTEYGAVNLHGKSLRQRGELLVSIAHPDFRAELLRELGAARHFVF